MANTRTMRTRNQAPKMERLEARVTKAQKKAFMRAAKIRGTTLTDFLLWSAQQAAAETIRESERLLLRDEAREAFVEALLNPASPNAAARRAARRYKQRFGG